MTTKEIKKDCRTEDKESGQETLLCLSYDDLCRGYESPVQRKTRIARKRVDPETERAIRQAFGV